MSFYIITITVLIFLTFFSKRNISLLEAYCSFLFGAYFQLVVDVQLSYRLHLYGYFDKGIELNDLLINFMFGIFGYLVANFYPAHYNKPTKIFYILAWCAYAILYETYSLHTEMFYYNGWKLQMSMLLYPIIMMIILGNLQFVKLLKRIN